MKSLAWMAGAALIGLSGAAYAQNAVGTGTNTGTDAAARSVSGVAGDTPTANSAAASAGTNNSAGATAGTDAAATSAGSATATQATDAASMPAGHDHSAMPAATASATPATATSGASATVQGQWATYDKDSTGGLNPLEFGTWIMAAQGNDMSKQVQATKTSKRANLPAIKVLNATAGEFAKADTDKDRAVSPAELTAYLGG